MVKNRIAQLEKENLELQTKVLNLEDKYERLINSVIALNKKINAVSKKEVKEDTDTIKKWLTDDRVDEVQPYLHKGVK